MTESCGVRKVERDQEGRDREWDGESNFSEAIIDVLGVDNLVIVAVPEEDVLLKSSQRFGASIAFSLGCGGRTVRVEFP